MRYQRPELPLSITGLAAARSLFAGCLAEVDPTQESLFVAHMDEGGRCLHLSRNDGDPCGVDFPLREILLDAAEHGSAGIVMAHNHPSGDAKPSSEDLRATHRLATATEALDCQIVDHLIFAGTECSSMRRLGYL